MKNTFKTLMLLAVVTTTLSFSFISSKSSSKVDVAQKGISKTNNEPIGGLGSEDKF